MTDSEQRLRDRQADLVLIIEATDDVLQTKAWQTLKELVFDREVDRLERALLNEAKSSDIDTDALYRLQGELLSARRYGDLKRYAEVFQNELKGIKDNQK